jgi:maltose O-acetyltransferase
MKRIIKYILKLFLNLVPPMLSFRFNRIMFALLGNDIHKSARIWSTLKIVGEVKIVIGADTFIGDNCYITGGKSTVEIGDYCDISSNVSFVTGSHHIDLLGKHIAGTGYSSDIYLGNRVWVGYGSTIMGGVTVGSNVIIAARSLVNKNLNENGIYGGIPAKLIRKL